MIETTVTIYLVENKVEMVEKSAFAGKNDSFFVNK